MTQHTATAATLTSKNAVCDPATSVTRSLLGYGVVAGPLYTIVALTQAFTREGFDLSRHQVSLLSNGDLGWIQITNFVLTGLMTIAFAVGLGRALKDGRGAKWAPRLIGTYGASLIAAGIFRADPALGFPAGTPTGGPVTMSWHALGHFTAGAIGFLALVIGCIVLARRFAGEGRKAWAAYSVATGVLFLFSFIGIASTGGAVVANVGFGIAVALAWTWVAAVAVHLYQRASK
ncbi:DUF998 domain-containing protein [Tenggerimyces flavus]|uniref:DUF998 domain-containing protein n=1 Tax=Tenggerimyces flavus TaxID=1708749 RepID=A0ABV7Y792_9ACTN|nr:DUF998 domain-containing protein [Tenggerimyces flavus]MBM7785100.1 putative membrane protein [Tenggerimyces flavus]